MSIADQLKAALGIGEPRTRPRHRNPDGRLDITLRDPTARQLLGDLQKGNWRSSQKMLDGTASPAERDFLTRVLCEWEGRPDWLDAWTQAEPSCSSAWLLSGAHNVRWAWQARGDGTGEQVAEDAVQHFVERLDSAEEELRRAAALQPGDPTPWAFLLISGRGLEVDAAEHASRHDELIRRDPFHRHGHSMTLQYRCEKWFGSHDAMFDFARESSRRAPEGDNLHGLIAEAHIEYSLMMDDPELEALYWRDPEVRGEIAAAARRSVLAPTYERNQDSIYEHNLFAFCAAQMNDREAAKPHYTGCRGIATRYPWQLLDGLRPEDAFNALQYRVGL